MINNLDKIDFNNIRNLIPSFIIIITIPFTVSIPNGIIFGITIYLLINIPIILIDYIINKINNYDNNDDEIGESLLLNIE